MPLSAAQYQQLIVTEVGDDAAGSVAANVALLWAKHDDQASDYVRYLYAKRDAVQLLMGRVRQMVTFKALDGANVNASDMMVNLQTMLEAVRAEIDEQARLLNGAGALDTLTTTAPIGPPAVGRPDANDPQYRGGDPYTPGVRAPGRTPV